jgi:transcription elongation factor Elf1
MKTYRCPKCQSSNCSVLYKVDETVHFKCQICEQYFSIKNIKKQAHLTIDTVEKSSYKRTGEAKI